MVSDGVGDGEMTRGVSGTWYCWDIVVESLGENTNCMRAGFLIRPAKS